MAAKKITKVIKLQIQAAKATMAPPVGPALGQAGVNGQQFCLQFNEQTKEQAGNIVPVVITVYEDRSFTFITKTPPASNLLKKAAGIESASGNPKTTIAGSVTKQQVRDIATLKLKDLNAYDVEAAMKIIEGTARQMGIAIKD